MKPACFDWGMQVLIFLLLSIASFEAFRHGGWRLPSFSGCSRPYRSSLWMIEATARSWQYDPSKIRNFCIIAHIDHGKSTLADRLLELTNTVQKRDMQEQLLDNLEIERERGITIKLQAARMVYKAQDGQDYLLNLIDTPGHVDFGYEVSRSLAACEGAILVVDATQGVEAQTLANVYLAVESDLSIVPVINKVDLPSADVPAVTEEIVQTLSLDNPACCSAKTGVGVEDILERVVKDVPPPRGRVDGVLRALIFDSYYDAYRGVVVFFRVVDGEIRKGDKVRFMNSGRDYEVLEVGVLTPSQVKVESLRAGEVGYMAANIKAVDHARVGDTITLTKFVSGSHTAGGDAAASAAVTALPGYAPPKPMVYAGVYPSDPDDYDNLREAMLKLKLNDAALSFQPETSTALGFGFRSGFLGLLHMEIVQERLEREYNLDLIITAPTVVYKIVTTDGEEQFIDSPAKMPDPATIEEVLEPLVRLEMLSPSEYVGPLMELAQGRRGVYKEMKYITETRASIIYELPLSEVITDFFDELKSRSKGYASMSFQDIGYQAEKLLRLDIKISGEDAPPLASIVHKDNAYERGREICEKLKELIPRQQFRVSIQACLGSKVIASSQISALMKDVLAKCYGGDITRKKKLLQKQAKGKKRMRAIGKVNIPQEAFLAVIRRGGSTSEE